MKKVVSQMEISTTYIEYIILWFCSICQLINDYIFNNLSYFNHFLNLICYWICQNYIIIVDFTTIGFLKTFNLFQFEIFLIQIYFLNYACFPCPLYLTLIYEFLFLLILFFPVIIFLDFLFKFRYLSFLFIISHFHFLIHQA